VVVATVIEPVLGVEVRDTEGPRPADLAVGWWAGRAGVGSLTRCERSATWSRLFRFEFEPTGPPDFAAGKGSPGRFELYVDGALVGAGEAPHTTPTVYEREGLSCAYDALAPVLPDVDEAPFTFTGTIHSVTLDAGGDPIEDDEATLEMIMAQQ
jgi:hypothetical protein